MSEQLFRVFAQDLEVRAAAKGGDGRTIYGIAVPYETPQRIDDQLTEQFARGAFNHQLRAAHRVRLAREHLTLGGALIGRSTLLRDDPAGLYFEARASMTPMGDETLELVRDGALQHVSIGFRERRNRRLGHITERVTADLVEIAVTLEGAYGDAAAAAGVRSRAGDPAEDAGDTLSEVAQILAGLPALPVRLNR